MHLNVSGKMADQPHTYVAALYDRDCDKPWLPVRGAGCMELYWMKICPTDPE